MRFRAIVGLLALVATLVAAPVAKAAPGWRQQGRLSAPSLSVLQPRVALDRVGNAVVVWERHSSEGNAIQAAVRLVFEGGWRPAQTLSSRGELAFGPKVAMDDAGNAVVVWNGFGEEDEHVQAAVRPARTGRWSPAVTVSPPGLEASEPDIAVSRGGLAIVAWWALGDTSGAVQARVARASTGAWGATETVSGGNSSWPSLAVDGAGNAVAVWTESGGANAVVRARARAATGGWSQPSTLSEPGSRPQDLDVASSPSGASVVIWTGTPDGALGVIRANARPSPSGAWSEAVDVSQGEPQNGGPRVVLDAGGNALATWQRRLGEESVVLESAARPAASGRWTATRTVTRTNGFFDRPDLAARGVGTAVSVWAGLDGPRDSGGDLIARARHASTVTGAWADAVQTLSSPNADAYGPHVALDPAGNVLAVWGQDVANRFLTEAAAYDAAGPVVSLTAPQRPRAGVRLRFTARVRDAWSGLAGAPAWTFGDGSQPARGARVTHVYRAPGSYSVTVTQADRLGNTTTARTRITVRRGR